ncbi:hypothetical protein ACSQ67_018693 [Phaseolus vulgaris]
MCNSTDNNSVSLNTQIESQPVNTFVKSVCFRHRRQYRSGFDFLGRAVNEIRSAPAIFLTSGMAYEQHKPTRPWIQDALPMLVVILIAAHVLAMVYWIYRLATQKQPQRRRKAH